MNLAILFSRGQLGIHAPAITIETHLANGLPKFLMVGLPETAVKESKDRVRSAIINSQYTFPARHITVNLAPAELPKEGARFDLPIALGILAAQPETTIVEGATRTGIDLDAAVVNIFIVVISLSSSLSSS